MSAFSFSHRVRYQETDAQGFVFNSRYLEWADIAMVEFLRSLGYTYTELVGAGCDPSLVTTTMECKRPGRFDDLLDIAVSCTHVGNSSFALRFVIGRGQETLAQIDTTYVNVDLASERSTPLPEAIAAVLRSAASAA